MAKRYTALMQPAKTVLLFAHGAGASSKSPWMKAWTKRLKDLGKVVAFDYPYMQKGRRAPDRLEKLIVAHREQLERVRRKFPQRKNLVLIGKSMGSRVGCHVSLEDEVNAVVCLGYPLRGINGKLRDEVLKEMRTPQLFVAGTRDPLCPLAELGKVRKRLRNKTELHIVESGNHSLETTVKFRKESGLSQEQVDTQTLEAIAAFLRKL
jgi:predicted alpha/beta-hydrolase family hydrolase